jgi:chromosome partitioning protein
MPTIIAVATHKGGTGKTVTAMALSAAFARHGHRTLLVDLDPQGHASLGLGVEVQSGSLTLRDAFSELAVPLLTIQKQTHLPNLHVIPSDIRLERMTHHMYTRPKREELLKTALDPVLPDYDFVVLDCPPSLGPLTETAIAAASLVIIPCQMEARAADGLVDVLELISLIKGVQFDAWGILVTKFDSRKSITNEAILAGLSSWQHKMFASRIPQSEPLNQAQIQRTDIFTFDPRSTGAAAYEALAQEIQSYGR